MINNFNPDSTERTIEHVKKIAFEIVNEAHATFRNDMNKMQDLWNVYNNVFDSKKYDYLTKVDDDLTYPAQIRDMASQVIRSKLNILESEQARRKMRLKAQVCDERSMKVKYEQRMKAVLEAIEASIGDRYAQVDETIRQVNEKLTDLENQLQVQPENEEAAMELEMLKQQMPLIRLEYGKMLRILNKEKVDMEDVTSKVSYFKSMNEVDILENICNAFISSLLMDQDKRDDIDSAFRDKLVTGRPTFLVYYDPKIKKAVIKQMEAMRSFYSRSSSSP